MNVIVAKIDFRKASHLAVVPQQFGPKEVVRSSVTAPRSIIAGKHMRQNSRYDVLESRHNVCTVLVVVFPNFEVLISSILSIGLDHQVSDVVYLRVARWDNQEKD